MTAKQLLKAKYRTQIFSGKKLLDICQRIERGEINQSSKYSYYTLNLNNHERVFCLHVYER